MNRNVIVYCVHCNISYAITRESFLCNCSNSWKPFYFINTRTPLVVQSRSFYHTCLILVLELLVLCFWLFNRPSFPGFSESVWVSQNQTLRIFKKRLKGFPYSFLSVGPTADPGVQAVGPQVTVNHPPCGRLPLLSARPAISQPQSITASWPVQSYTAWWQRHICVNNLPKVVTQLLLGVRFEPTTCWLQV